MPDYDDVVALTIARAPKGASLDAATVMRVAAYARKARGFQVTAEDMAGLSDAARRRLATPTANPAPPSMGEEYLRGVDEEFDVAGNQIALGGRALYSSARNALGTYDDSERADAANTLREQSHALSAAQERAGSLNAAGGALVAGPSLGVGILGSATQRAVDMQDQGKDPTQLQNRVNLGGTAALQSALTFSGAATGAKALNAVAGGSALGMTGARGAAAMAGTGAASALGATGAQHGLDIATDNSEFAPQGEDYAINALSAAALPAGEVAAGVRRSGGRAPRPTRIVDMDNANGPTMIEPATAPNIRGADPVPSPTDNGVIVPGSMAPELAATAADARREVPKRSQVQRHLAEMRMKAKPDTDAAPMDGFDPEGERANQTAYDAEQQGLAKESAQNDLQAQRDLAPDYAAEAARKLGLPEGRTADLVAQARGEAASQRMGETVPNPIADRLRLAAPNKNFIGDFPDIPQRETNVQPAPRAPVVDEHAQAQREQQSNRMRNETNAQAEELGVANKQTRDDARTAIKEAHRAERIDRRTAQRLFAELDQRKTSEHRALALQQAHERMNELARTPTASDMAEAGDASGYQTNTDSEDAAAFGREADARLPGEEAPTGHLSPAAQDFVAKQSPETQAALAESLDHLKQHPDPQGDLGNLQMVVQGFERRAARKAALPHVEGVPIDDRRSQREFASWDMQGSTVAGKPSSVVKNPLNDAMTHFTSHDAQGRPDGVLKLLDTDDEGKSVMVSVRPDARRQGVATRLYAAVKEAGFDPEAFSAGKNNSLTSEGAAFRAGRLKKAKAETAAKPVEAAVVEPAPEPAAPRTFFRDDLGKLKEVTDRIDPKHYEGQTLTAYEKLTPVQQKQADTKAQARRVTDRGAAINPAVAVVGAAKAVGRAVKAVAKSVPTEEIGSRWRSAREFMGDDAATRLKSSSDPEVRAVGTKFSNALGHSRDSQTRMNKSIDEATRSVSVTSKAEANELREANKPIKGANGAVSSKLYDVLSGKAPANTPLLKRIKAGFTQSNDVTQQEMKAQGVKIRANAQQGVDIVRQYLHPDADAALQGTNKVFQKALIQKIADTNVHKTGAKKGQNYTFDEVAKDFAPSGEMGNAAVRREAMEQGRKYLLPPWVEAGGEMHQVLNLDPRNYVRSTANSAAQRVGTVRAFGPDATMESIRNSILLNSAPDHRALGRALDAYSGTSKELDLNDPRKFTRLVRSAKGILSALRTTATAPLNMTEPLNMVGQVPMHHAVIGAVNAAKHRGRAVREGGVDADILNRVDLRGGAAEGVDNTAALLRRGSLTNATNRMTHAMGYEAGRSWADGMRDAGKVSKGDAGYLDVNHIPEYVREAFENGHATDADVMHVAKAVGENLSGRKGSMAEAGRLSRQEMVKTWGPMFLQYGENRVRNVMRSWDAIKGAAKKGDYVTAGRLFGSRLTGTTVSAAAATAVGQVMRYGVEGLGMSLESGELKPFLGNVLGGGASDIAIRATQDDDAGNLVASLMWPVGAAADAWDVATGRKGVTDAVPAAARVRDTAEGRDVAGDKAYSLYWKAQKIQGRRSSDNPTRSGARSDIRRALMRKDYVGATAKINEYTEGLPKRDKLAFLRDSRLLPGNGEKGLTEKRRLRDEIGAAAYAYIANHDRVLDDIIAPLE